MSRTDESPAGTAQHPERLSIIIPMFNGEAWARRTIEQARIALQNAGWDDAEILVVNDGSTDGTREVLDELADELPDVRAIHTENQGRLLARRTGLEAATGHFVLFLDTRVLLDPDALKHLRTEMERDPQLTVWNAHVETHSANAYALFWQAITFVAWRDYLANPRPISFGIDEYDRFPKGTTCFFAPRRLFLEAYAGFESHYDDPREVNDDTSLLRLIAADTPIRIDPGFSCTYFARDSLEAFLRHSYHRGVRFVDGYLHRDSRYLVPLLAFLALSPVAPIVALRRPKLSLAAGAASLIGGLLTLLRLGVPPKTAASFTVLAPPFSVVYGAGIWKGIWLATRTRMKRR